MNYTLYRGNNNVTGELLNVYVNGKLEHRSLLINSTELNNNFTVVPLYSKSGNYNVTVLNTNGIIIAGDIKISPIITYFRGILFFIVNHHCIKLQDMIRSFKVIL